MKLNANTTIATGFKVLDTSKVEPEKKVEKSTSLIDSEVEDI